MSIQSRRLEQKNDQRIINSHAQKLIRKLVLDQLDSKDMVKKVIQTMFEHHQTPQLLRASVMTRVLEILGQRAGMEHLMPFGGLTKVEPNDQSPEFFKTKNQLQVIHDAIFCDSNSRLLQKPANSISAKDLLLTMLCASAIMHSGIHEIAQMNAFLAEIKKPCPVHRAENLYWMALKITDDAAYTNSISGGIPSNETLLFLHPVTALLLNDWAEQSHYIHLTADEFTATSIHEKLSNVLELLGLKNPPLKKWLSVSLYVQEHFSGLDHTLKRLHSGGISSCSLPNSVWRDLIEAPVGKKNGQINIVARQLSVDKKDSKTKSNVFEALKQAVAAPPNRKVSSETVIRKLQEIETETLAERHLVAWSCHKLKSISPNSLRRYIGTFFYAFLHYTAAKDLSNFNSGDFEQLYQNILADAPKKQTYYISGRLGDFHQYLNRYFNYPSAKIGKGTKSIPHIRAGFISEPLFVSLCETIEQSHFSLSVKQQLISLVIIAYRLGLRISELLKLKLCDIETSEQLLLAIRSNEFGDNKSVYSKRQLPINIMLTDGEYLHFNHFLARRRASASNHTQQLLFHAEGDPYTQLDQGFVSTYISSLLRILSPDTRWVFHHFRHTALSRLFLVLHHQILFNSSVPFQLNLLSYNQKQCEQICQSLFGANIANKYQLLADFAGHESAETTFQNYIHLSGFITGLYFRQSTQPIDIWLIKTLTRTSERKLAQLKDEQNQVRHLFTLTNKKRMTRCITYQPMQIPKYLQVKEITADLQLCYQSLLTLESGKTVQEVASYYRLPEILLRQWHKTAQDLADLKSRKNQSRHISKERLGAFLPAALHHRDDRHLFSELLSVYEKTTETSALVELAELVLQRTNATHNHITLVTADELTRYMPLFKGTLPFIDMLQITDNNGEDISLKALHLSKHSPYKIKILARSTSHVDGTKTQFQSGSPAFRLFCYVVVIFHRCRSAANDEASELGLLG